MNANRMCSKLTTLAATAVLCCAPAFAGQNSTATSSSPMNDAQPNMASQNGMSGTSGQSGTAGQTGTSGQTGAAGQGGMARQSGVASATAQTGDMSGMNGNTGSMGKSGTSSQDKMFMKKAAAGSLAEIQLGQLALQKSSNDQVKQFAQKMVDDHTKLNDQAKPVAQQLGMAMPTQPMAKDQAMMTKLQAMSGADFDKAYMKNMVKDHEEDLKEFKKEATSGKDQQVKDLAQQGQPIIQGHLDMAKQIASSVGAMTGGSKGSGNGNSGTGGGSGSNQ